MDEPLVSVFTCVYNRADRIHRVFNSMKAQTYRNIEHVIVDDGSTDNLGELLEQYKKEAPFPVKIIRKENGGKHTATNIAWDNCTGDYIAQLDSDDEYFPDTIEYLVGMTKEVPPEDLNEYWCFLGRCCTQFSNEMIGKPFPDNINHMSFKRAYEEADATGGDKMGLMRASVLKTRRYPEPPGVKFVPEGVLWREIKTLFRTRYSNRILLRYYVNEGDCLSHQKMSLQTLTNKVWSCRWQIENMKNLGTDGWKCLLPYAFCRPVTRSEYRKGTSYFIKGNSLINTLLAILYIPALIVSPLVRILVI